MQLWITKANVLNYLRPISRWETYKEFNERQVVELISKFQPDIWWGDGGHELHSKKLEV